MYFRRQELNISEEGDGKLLRESYIVIYTMHNLDELRKA